MENIRPRNSWQSRERSVLTKSGVRRHKPDYILLIVALCLLVIGLIVVYSIGPGLAAIKQVDENYYVQKQAISIGLGIIGFTIAAFMPVRVWRSSVKALIAVAFVSVFAVVIFGEEVYGAKRWVQVGGFSFQSAELIKLALFIGLADFFASRKAQRQLHHTRKTLYVVLAVVGCIGVVVAGLQSDLGSAAVMVLMLGIMAVLAGMPLKKLVLIGAVISIGAILMVSVTPYRRARVATFLHPTADCQGSGYQSCQALIAVGSGGLFGKGLGNSVQAYGYLPEAANDSIFAIYGEKFGFLGSAILVVLYGVLFARMKRIIDHTVDDFMRFVVVGALAWLSAQTIINIGAMIGLLPLKGITLPLVSYGGTSIIFVMIAIGIVFGISRYTAYSPVPLEIETDTNNGGRNDDIRRRRRLRGTHYTQLSRSKKP